MASIQCVCAVLQNKTPALPSRELLPEIESRIYLLAIERERVPMK